MCNFFHLMYGSDTRSVRVFNLVIHLVWIYLILTHLLGVIQVDLPEKIEPSFTVILGVCITTVLVTAFSFTETEWKVRLKFISLTLGSITQILIALKFVTNYPPFDVMVIVCSLLAFWFVGGAFYVKYKQVCDNELMGAS